MKIEKIKKGIQTLQSCSLNLFYPVKCPFCGAIEQNGICGKCREKILVIREPRCRKCGKPLRKAEEEFCYDCKALNHEFEEGRSLWVHKEPVSHAIYALKYQNKRIYGELFGREMAIEFSEYLIEKKVNLIVPIPLHRKRQRVRGYNQTEILADFIGRYTGISVESGVLVRQKYTDPQKQLNDKQRRRNIRDAFAVKKEVWSKRIVLIDDIYMTGSTLDEAARVLYRAGAEKVYFLTISIGQGY